MNKFYRRKYIFLFYKNIIVNWIFNYYYILFILGYNDFYIKCNNNTTLTQNKILNLVLTWTLYLTLTLTCPDITDIAMIRVAECCQLLQHLRLWIVLITDIIAMIRIAKHCPLLQHLYLGCPNVTNLSVFKVAECCLMLQFLKLESCTVITNVAVITIAEWCPGIQELLLHNCPAITDILAIGMAVLSPWIRFVNNWYQKRRDEGL